MRTRRLFMSKARRDAEFKRLGGTKAGYKKTSHTNQLLHPMYVEDYAQETGIVLSEAEKGFGNSIYQTYFKCVYILDRPNTNFREGV